MIKSSGLNQAAQSRLKLRQLRLALSGEEMGRLQQLGFERTLQAQPLGDALLNAQGAHAARNFSLQFLEAHKVLAQNA